MAERNSFKHAEFHAKNFVARKMWNVAPTQKSIALKTLHKTVKMLVGRE